MIDITIKATNKNILRLFITMILRVIYTKSIYTKSIYLIIIYYNNEYHPILTFIFLIIKNDAYFYYKLFV